MAAATGDGEDLLVALRHPLRRMILKTMVDNEDPLSPREVADLLDMPLSNTSYHMRVLAERQAVKLVDTAPARGSMQHFYEMTVEAGWALQVLGDPKMNGTDG